ncbi:MAG: sigma-70 family RNA polymerase sigma factor [Actinobacteria bacterium]|nr:sigma-70 family RNA polymerase sigma factor [Actinomycetota bacterium]MBU4360128.1 sigma-70 family RNA polymerase sigma factor [Actinomycetota bacterium]MBU4390873.1 sigma-70 family RNA polymerase sigma factor [Actinomycetota bacterium]MBU4403328.1 sigma-70 family RNA polymerase sigma factor [Actinomycetota bacterium]MBU4441883.1 sigma-70 family RNA polymerase sigma factor [Actinomycetota bacterium]
MTEDREEVPKSLVCQAIEGNRWAYGKIYRLCYEDVFDYIIRRVGNRGDAEDLTMKVFVKGLESISRYEERGLSVRAWFYRIAHNLVVDHYRTLKKELELSDLPEVVDTGRDIDLEMVRRETVSDVYEEIRKMPTAQAEVLILRFMEDMSVTETAMILEKKEATVRALQFKGVNNLKKRMAEKEREPEANG